MTLSQKAKMWTWVGGIIIALVVYDVVLGWWGPRQCGARPGAIRLAGLDAGARYRDTGSGRQHWGAALMAGRSKVEAECQ